LSLPFPSYFLAGLFFRTTDHAELGGSHGHDRNAKKAAAIKGHFFWQVVH